MQDSSLTTPGPPSSDAAGMDVLRSDSAQLLELSIVYRRYLLWLMQLQRSADAACDDAYTLDRVLLQGVLPLRQRTAAAQAGLRAALYELLIGAVVREHADVLKARQQLRQWKLTGGAAGRSGDLKAATYSHYPSAAAPERAEAATPAVVHSESPPCPCRAFVAQQQEQQLHRRAGSDGSASPRSRSSSSSDDDSHADGAAGSPGGESAAPRHSTQSSELVSPTLPRRLSPFPSPATVASSASFPSRLKDAVQAGSGAGLARTMATRSPRPSLSASSSALETARGRWSPIGSARRGTPLAAALLLLPLTVADPLRPDSAATVTDDRSEGGSGNSSRTSRPAESTAERCPTLPGVAAVPVAVESLPQRSLHSLWSHLAPEDLRRCLLCTGQAVVQGSWHALYLLQLMTLVSAAPSMAAPLPLPPPQLLRTHPVEALLLLLQTGQRCLVAGVTLASCVCEPDTAAAEKDGRPRSATSQRLRTEEGVVCGIAQSVLGVTYALGGAAVAQLWPLHRPRKAAESAARQHLSEVAEAAADPTAAAALPSVLALLEATCTRQRSVVEMTGDVVALRCAAFHAAFLLLMTRDGTDACETALRTASAELCHAARRLQAAQLSGEEESQHGGCDGPADDDGSGFPEQLCANLTAALDALNAGAADRSAAGGADGADTQARRSESHAVLRDDLRTLCCTVALLAAFAALVREAERPRPDLGAAATTTDAAAAALVATLLDSRVYPTLVALQNSARGASSAQARPLLALWWLLRRELVRMWANTAVGGSATIAAVLDVRLTIVEGDSDDQASPVVMHWSAWAKEASRAAVRASNAASEFVSLTLAPAPPTLLAVTTVLSGGAAGAAEGRSTLRWRLTVEDDEGSGDGKSDHGVSGGNRVRVGCLPVPWVRLWILLCPTLFHISPTDSLALRHVVQQEEEEEEAAAQQGLASGHGSARDGSTTAGAPAAAPAGASRGRAGGAPTVTGRGASTSTTARPAEGSSQAAKVRGVRSTGAAAPAKSLRQADSNGKGRSGGGAASVSKKKAAKSPAPRNTEEADAEAVALAQAEGHRRRAALLQYELQCSTAPVHFWTRWCWLFLPTSSPAPPLNVWSSAPPYPQGVQSSASLSLPLSGRESVVCSAVDKAVTLLRTPSLLWGAPLPPSHLVASLQAAFPLLTPRDLVSALETQAREFLVRSPQAQPPLSASLPPPAAPGGQSLFPSYSIAAALPSVRATVDQLHAALRATAPAAAAVAVSEDASSAPPLESAAPPGHADASPPPAAGPAVNLRDLTSSAPGSGEAAPPQPERRNRRAPLVAARGLPVKRAAGGAKAEAAAVAPLAPLHPGATGAVSAPSS